jgi:beta-lactamase regulating signal transducer with metallopeptidase domain
MGNQFLITMSIVALAVGLTAMIAGALCRRAAPSVRNLVWNAALLACAVAPVALILGPQLTIQLPARLVATASHAIGGPNNRAANLPATSQPGVSSGAFESVSHRTSEAIGKIVLAVWLSGMVFFAIRFLRQLLFARRLVRRGTRATHDKLGPLLAAAKSALGVRADVTVLESAEIDIPIATGILHATILLPASANEWGDDELRVVLLHELAHVRRADIWARAAAMVACGLHWFNPVVWMLSALATRDAELAADDLVLRAGVRPSSYADTLLNLAASMLRYPYAQPAMPLARPAFLADRVHAILRDSGIRREIGDLTRSTVLIGSCTISMLAACVRFSSLGPETPKVGRSAQTSQSRTATMTGISKVAMAPKPAPSPARSDSVVLGHAPTGTVDATAARLDSAWVQGATDGLIAALDDQSPQVRGEAAHALGKLGAVRAQQPLSRLVNDPDKFVQYEARQALSALDRAR